jgi:hypothetical protein
MNKRILEAMVWSSFGVVLLAAPAMADTRADVGPLHIHIATDAPPRAQREYRTVRKDRDAVWIKGYWDRQDGRWAWVAGRWERPSDRHDRWISARYRRESGAWRYEPAHWSHQQIVEGDEYQQWRREHRSEAERRRDDERERNEQRPDSRRPDGERPRN